MSTKAEVAATLLQHADELDEVADGWPARFEAARAAVAESTAILRDAAAETKAAGRVRV